MQEKNGLALEVQARETVLRELAGYKILLVTEPKKFEFQLSDPYTNLQTRYLRYAWQQPRQGTKVERGAWLGVPASFSPCLDQKLVEKNFSELQQETLSVIRTVLQQGARVVVFYNSVNSPIIRPVKISYSYVDEAGVSRHYFNFKRATWPDFSLLSERIPPATSWLPARIETRKWEEQLRMISIMTDEALNSILAENGGIILPKK